MPLVTRVKPEGWGTGEIVSSPQITSLDANIVTVGSAVDVLSPDGQGVRRPRYFTSFAALRADTSHANADVVFVKRYGFYSYDSSSADAPVEPLFIKPTDVAGNGRWLWQNTAITAGGLDTRFLASQVQGTMVGNWVGNFNNFASVATAPQYTVASQVIYSDVQIGDLIVCHWGFDLNLHSSMANATAGTSPLTWLDNGGSSIQFSPAGAMDVGAGQNVFRKVGAAGFHSYVTSGIASYAGSYIVGLSVGTSTALPLYFSVRQIILTAQVFRP